MYEDLKLPIVDDTLEIMRKAKAYDRNGIAKREGQHIIKAIIVAAHQGDEWVVIDYYIQDSHKAELTDWLEKEGYIVEWYKHAHTHGLIIGFKEDVRSILEEQTSLEFWEKYKR